MIFDPRQRPTVTTNADCAFSARKTTVRQLLSEFVSWLRCGRMPDLRRRFYPLFFNCTHDCVHIYFQHPCRVPNAAAIECHLDDLLLNARFMRPMGIVELKTTATGFTFVAGSAAGRLAVRLMAVGRESFTPNLILIATVAARNSDSYHAIKTNSPYLGHDRQWG